MKKEVRDLLRDQLAASVILSIASGETSKDDFLEAVGFAEKNEKEVGIAQCLIRNGYEYFLDGYGASGLSLMMKSDLVDKSELVAKQKQPVPPPPPRFVYLMKNSRNNLHKIGKSKNPKHRESVLQSEEPEVILLHAYKAEHGEEEMWHARFAEKRIRGEWFKLDDNDVREFLSR